MLSIEPAGAMPGATLDRRRTPAKAEFAAIPRNPAIAEEAT